MPLGFRSSRAPRPGLLLVPSWLSGSSGAHVSERIASEKERSKESVGIAGILKERSDFSLGVLRRHLRTLS